MVDTSPLRRKGKWPPPGHHGTSAALTIRCCRTRPHPNRGPLLGPLAQPVPPRRGLVHRPAQARGVRRLDREHLPAREGGLDLLSRCAPDQPPPPARAEAQQQHGGPRVGKRTDTSPQGKTLFGVQPLGAADVEEEVERPQVADSSRVTSPTT